VKTFLRNFTKYEDITHPSKEDFIAAMSSEDSQSKLFPSGRIIVGWRPLGVIEENLSEIFDERQVAWTKEEGESCPRWMNIFTEYPCQTGMGLIMDMYGTDPELMVPHIAHALDVIVKQIPDFSGTFELLLYSAIQFPLHPDDLDLEMTPGALHYYKTHIAIHRNLETLFL
jgi:hypothetical protein